MFAERYEEDIEDWYYNLQEQEDLMKYLCAERYLKDKDQSMETCLSHSNQLIISVSH